jgi:predicted transcriptional regulator
MSESDTGVNDVGDGVYECGECASVSFGEAESTCCGESMAPVEAEPVKPPELAVVLRDVFGISETGLKVCLCLMEEGESTANEIADRLGIDRSTVGRQLNHLTDIGVLDKRQRILKDGGYVHVYSPVPVEEVRKRLTVGLYAWMDEALELVEHINREKLDALARADGEGVGSDDDQASIYWDE